MIVLDTHVLLWMDRDDPALGKNARALIAQAWRAGKVCVSAISFWECAMLAQRERIRLPCAVDTWRADLIESGLKEFALDGKIALLACELENMHRDPADRFIAASAIHHSATLITADEKLLEWKHAFKRIDART
jgi:PIN domain nuclease of toxin-antitoxin system